ncbi:MAG: hypothetical protein AAGK37_18440 [Pseudomonadota bacterium]
MNQQVAIEGIEARLRDFAGARDIAPALRDKAQRYLSRLVSPVRVTLLGRPTPGKASLLSEAIGEPVLPALDHPPTVELRYGDIPAAQITRPDGSVTEPHDTLDVQAFQDAILAVIERPSPLLRRISFLDVQADEAAADQRAAIAWAAPRTDIALWCAARFDDTDRALWAGVPDKVKDHAYLVLTDCSGKRASKLRDELGDEFHDVYALDFKVPGASSGISPLIERLLNHARLGRQADADSALLFLRAQETLLDEPRRTPSRPVRSRPRSQPAPKMPEPETVTVEIESVDSDAFRATERPRTRPITRPAPKSDEAVELFSTGLRYIRRRSTALLSKVRAGDAPEGPAIAAHCGETLVHLSEMLTMHDEAGEPTVSQLTDTVIEAESLVVLMENEKGEKPALDALSILLQVRRDFEACLAA